MLLRCLADILYMFSKRTQFYKSCLQITGPVPKMAIPLNRGNPNLDPKIP